MLGSKNLWKSFLYHYLMFNCICSLSFSQSSGVANTLARPRINDYSIKARQARDLEPALYRLYLLVLVGTHVGGGWG
jgi:hypothetical protein